MIQNGILQQIQLLQYEMGARVGVCIIQGEVHLIMVEPHIILLPMLQNNYLHPNIYININYKIVKMPEHEIKTLLVCYCISEISEIYIHVAQLIKQFTVDATHVGPERQVKLKHQAPIDIKGKVKFDSHHPVHCIFNFTL